MDHRRNVCSTLPIHVQGINIWLNSSCTHLNALIFQHEDINYHTEQNFDRSDRVKSFGSKLGSLLSSFSQIFYNLVQLLQMSRLQLVSSVSQTEVQHLGLPITLSTGFLQLLQSAVLVASR